MSRLYLALACAIAGPVIGALALAHALTGWGLPPDTFGLAFVFPMLAQRLSTPQQESPDA